MAKCIPDLSSIDFTGLHVSTPKLLNNGAKIAHISLANKKPFVFKTPEGIIPYGLGNWEGSKFHIDLSLDDNCAQFKEKIVELERLVIDEVFQKSQQFFGKTKSKDIVEELFTSCLKYSKNDRYPPTMKLKMPFHNGKFNCDAYDCNKQPITINEESFSKGSKVTCIVQCTGIWVANKFGITFNVVQAKVSPKVASRIEGYAFVDDSDEEIEV